MGPMDRGLLNPGSMEHRGKGTINQGSVISEHSDQEPVIMDQWAGNREHGPAPGPGTTVQ